MNTVRPLLRETFFKSSVLSSIKPSNGLVPCITSTRNFVTSVSDTTEIPTNTTTNNTISPAPVFMPQSEQFKKDPRAEILYATLPFVNEYGWSNESLVHGVRSLGHPSVAHGMFPGGESGLIDAYLCDQRRKFADLVKEKYVKGDLDGKSRNDKVLALTSLRLKMNRPYIKKWPEALAIMARPSNVRMSLKNLGDIADDIWYYAGDRSSDVNWYAKRISLATIYSASELIMIRDASPDYTVTQRFLEKRLREASIIGASQRQVTNMLHFGVKSAVSAISTVSK